ncbi:hypothetical protein BGW36DRAFT_391559 [Talaromyces proteolyticus]|uniref:Mid2 domain-containing protein n=1 Tax=Talaromyces proteolyticus TaxID=1131652 RepID=A0AAD4KDC5_9EURO|nr:uncharacterized protein BGW36DRAFT_391559 [Talaromyces proteolyticus]KAH8689002.1 hypothetical protein BGW36DRAFT_391559 [Talaromyces proteolyticus]
MSESTTCYYRNGTVAENDTPCANSEMCCPSGDACMSNGLCRDKNNFQNGSTVTFPGGVTYNYTGLYYTPSCRNETYDSCSIQCTTYDSYKGQYIWACNAALTSYCCHLDSDNLGQDDCCSHGIFSLASPVILGDTVSSTTAPTMTAATTTSGSPAKTDTNTTSSPSVTSTPISTPAPSSAAPLSSGAKAGIGVGVAAAVIIIIVLAAMWYRAARRNRPQINAAGATVTTYEKSELDATVQAQRLELDATTHANRQQVLSELPAN